MKIRILNSGNYFWQLSEKNNYLEFFLFKKKKKLTWIDTNRLKCTKLKEFDQRLKNNKISIKEY